jgi:hypothetical protein
LRRAGRSWREGQRSVSIPLINIAARARVRSERPPFPRTQIIPATALASNPREATTLRPIRSLSNKSAPRHVSTGQASARLPGARTITGHKNREPPVLGRGLSSTLLFDFSNLGSRLSTFMSAGSSPSTGMWIFEGRVLARPVQGRGEGRLGARRGRGNLASCKTLAMCARPALRTPRPGRIADADAEGRAT